MRSGTCEKHTQRAHGRGDSDDDSSPDNFGDKRGEDIDDGANTAAFERPDARSTTQRSEEDAAAGDAAKARREGAAAPAHAHVSIPARAHTCEHAARTDGTLARQTDSETPRSKRGGEALDLTLLPEQSSPTFFTGLRPITVLPANVEISSRVVFGIAMGGTARVACRTRQ